MTDNPIKTACEQREWTQVQLIEALVEAGADLSQPTWSQYENDRRAPFSIIEVEALAEVLGLSAAELVGYFAEIKADLVRQAYLDKFAAVATHTNGSAP
jgi:transcriptional regulator with XRE-family HTH domain